MHNRTEQFLNDPVFPLLIRMSAPNTIAFFIQAIVVLAEVWFISKLGTTSLAAVALAFPVIMHTQQMAFGALGGAVTSSIARSLGAEDKERAEKLLWHSLLLSCCGYLLFFLIFLCIIFFKSIKKIKIHYLRKNYKKLNFLFIYFIIFLMNFFPLQSTGSIFSTSNATYIFVILSLLASNLPENNLNKKS